MTNGSPVAVVIDDERDIRDMVGVALRHEGWTVQEAADGRAALELVRGALPQLLVVDLMMSGMTGLEFCHKLLALPGGGDVPVLLISGINEKARLLQDFWELPLRYKNFLRKPFGLDELLKTIQGMLPPSLRPQAPAAVSAHPMAGVGPVTSSAPEPPPWMQGVKLTPIEANPPRSAQSTPSPPIAAPAVPPAPRPAPAPAAAEPEHRSGYRILVVDDEPDIRMIMETALSMYHTVATAENGMEALKQIDAFYPDFVLSDINMPVLNGLETAEAIRRHPVMCRVPIFFLTAERGADMPKRSYDVGGNLFLRKPVDPFRLLNYIDYFLKETGLEAEYYWTRRGQRKGTAPTAASAPAAPAAPNALRLLMVDFNIENHNLVKRLLGEAGEEGRVAGGPFETLWTEDPRTALGNLARWQPDVILYNPRNPVYDGVAFGQTLRLQKMADQCVVLIGARFYEADLDYATRVLKTPAIDIAGSEPMIIKRLGEVLQHQKAKLKPKEFAIGELQAEEAERQRELQKTSARTARERETFRQRYTKIQEFIDQKYSQ
jgi:CheY-like chemotaxis protein